MLLPGTRPLRKLDAIRRELCSRFQVDANLPEGIRLALERIDAAERAIAPQQGTFDWGRDEGKGRSAA